MATPTLKAALVGVNVGVQAQSAYTETAIFYHQARTVRSAKLWGILVYGSARLRAQWEISRSEVSKALVQLINCSLTLGFVSTNALRCRSWIDCTYHTLVLDSQWVNQTNEET